VLKLSPETMTIEALLPDDISFDNFSVTGDGFVVYRKGNGQQFNCRVKCPGGKSIRLQILILSSLVVIYIRFVTIRLSNMKLSVTMIC